MSEIQQPEENLPKAGRFELKCEGGYNKIESKLKELDHEFVITAPCAAIGKYIIVWDVEDPAFSGPEARKLAEEMANLTGNATYLSWWAIVGWTVEPAKK